VALNKNAEEKLLSAFHYYYFDSLYQSSKLLVTRYKIAVQLEARQHNLKVWFH